MYRIIYTGQGVQKFGLFEDLLEKWSKKSATTDDKINKDCVLIKNILWMSIIRKANIWNISIGSLSIDNITKYILNSCPFKIKYNE